MLDALDVVNKLNEYRRFLKSCPLDSILKHYEDKSTIINKLNVLDKRGIIKLDELLKCPFCKTYNGRKIEEGIHKCLKCGKEFHSENNKEIQVILNTKRNLDCR